MDEEYGLPRFHWLEERGELTSGVVERGLENVSENERVDEEVEREETTVRIRANPRLWGAPRQKPPFRESQYTTELQFDINASALLVTPYELRGSRGRVGGSSDRRDRGGRPRIREQDEGCLSAWAEKLSYPSRGLIRRSRVLGYRINNGVFWMERRLVPIAIIVTGLLSDDED